MTAVTSNRLMNRFSYWTRNRNVRYTMRDDVELTISFDLTPELELAKDNANLPEPIASLRLTTLQWQPQRRDQNQHHQRDHI